LNQLIQKRHGGQPARVGELICIKDSSNSAFGLLLDIFLIPVALKKNSAYPRLRLEWYYHLMSV
jgi:hypothetical protein